MRMGRNTINYTKTTRLFSMGASVLPSLRVWVAVEGGQSVLIGLFSLCLMASSNRRESRTFTYEISAHARAKGRGMYFGILGSSFTTGLPICACSSCRLGSLREISRFIDRLLCFEMPCDGCNVTQRKAQKSHRSIGNLRPTSIVFE